MRIHIRHLPALALLLPIACLTSGPGSALEVYKYIDSQGRVHLTDRPPHDGYRLIQKAGKKLRVPQINLRDKEINRKRFSRNIAAVADRFQVPKALRTRYPEPARSG